MTDTIYGSCLCGEVEYEVTGEPVRFYHCHCSRCRKFSGTGHASNLLMTPATGITWKKGEANLRRYKVPEAERFYNLFCVHCGSPMPRVVPELNAVIIPAGTLDCDPPMQPNGRIFWGSRADWSCEAGDIPVFDEYPPAS